MKSVWLKNTLVLAVLFVLAFGVMTFYALTQNAEAQQDDGSSPCDYLRAQCYTEAFNVVNECYGDNVDQQRCAYAYSDYERVCTAAANACNG